MYDQIQSENLKEIMEGIRNPHSMPVYSLLKIALEMDVEAEVEPRDFSEPWKSSDAVLVVEEERLHVHRAVLAIASPVFEKMFSSDFQEKDKKEIPLPGKSSTEVKELLSLIYPFASEKQITEENCYFLVELAHEYQIDAIVEKCEDYIVAELETKPKGDVLADLIFAQTYRLEKLRGASVHRSYNLSLEELKNDEMYHHIQSENLKEIMEGIINRLQFTSHKTQEIRFWALQSVDGIVRVLTNHAAQSKHILFPFIGYKDTDSSINALQHDYSHRCNCGALKYPPLSETAHLLRELKWLLESLNTS